MSGNYFVLYLQMINNKKQTSFIKFLVKTFSLKSGVYKEEERSEKSGFYESTKLKKMLNIFIEDEGEVKEDIDDKKSAEWKQTIVAKSLGMHNSKKKKEKQDRKSVYSVREKSAEKKEGTKGLLFQPWALGVTSACLAALIFSVSIVYFSPDTAYRIAHNADKAIIETAKVLDIIPATQDFKELEENNNKTFGILTRKMRGDFIFKNTNQLKDDLSTDDTLRLSFEDVAGRVAGMVEENYDHSRVEPEKENFLGAGFKKIVNSFKRFIDNFRN